ncbi:DUF6059 family protein [Streptomyces sp. NPDC001709]
MGLLSLGTMYYAPIGLALWSREASETKVLDGPPPGHPERLVLISELSPAERELWHRIWSVG